MIKEIWRRIDEFPDYKVSNQGRVMRKDGLILNGITTSEGFRRISFTKNGITKTRFVHRLVAIAFVRKRGEQTAVIHKDGDHSNNSASNLSWMTLIECLNTEKARENRSKAMIGNHNSVGNKSRTGMTESLEARKRRSERMKKEWRASNGR